MSDVHRSSIAVEGVGAHWSGKFVPIKEKEADEDSSHPKPPVGLHYTQPNRKDEK
jgi:hypothetical protein